MAGAGSPHNAADLNTLAGQIAADFYAWLKRSYDLSAIGLYPLPPCGYEDYHWLHFGNDSRGRQQAHTRVATLPVNFGAAANWCQVTLATAQCEECGSGSGSGSGGSGSGSSGTGSLPGSTPWPGPTLRVRLIQDLVGCESAQAVPIYFDASGNPHCAPQAIAVFDPLNKVGASMLADPETGTVVAAGNQAEVRYQPDAKRWEIAEFGAGCSLCSSNGSGSGSGGSGSGSGCVPVPAWIRALPGYSSSGQFFLMISGGCLQLIPAAQCVTSSGSGSGA